MDIDLIFVVGVTLSAFAIPAAAGAYAETRFPRLALIMLVVGVGAVSYAMQQNPDVYTVSTVDDVVIDVVGRYVN